MNDLIRKAGLCLLDGAHYLQCDSRAGWAAAYSNRKVFSGFVEYSNDSSHMLLGYAEGRKITALGASFEATEFSRLQFIRIMGRRGATFHDRDRSHHDGLCVEVSATAQLFRDGVVCFAGAGGHAGKKHAL